MATSDLSGARGLRGDVAGNYGTFRQAQRLSKRLEKAGKDASQLNEVMYNAGMIIVKDAKRRAPVGGGSKSPHDPHPGALRDSIRAGAARNRVTVRAGGTALPHGGGPLRYARVQDTGSKAQIEESTGRYSTRFVNHRGSRGRVEHNRGIAGNLYFTNAIRFGTQKVQTYVSKSMQELMNKNFG